MLRAIIFDLGNTIIEQKVDIDRRLDQMSLNLMPGVEAALRELHPRYKIALLTNTQQSSARDVSAALEILSIRQYFDAVITSVDVGVEKPDRRIFAVVLGALKASPEECVMVGNDRSHDIQPAKDMGMRTAFFTLTIDPTYYDPDIQFSHFRELPRLLSALEDGERDRN